MVYLSVFPRILIGLNTFSLNSKINILRISHNLHNDSKKFFFFVSLNLLENILCGGDAEQQFGRT